MIRNEKEYREVLRKRDALEAQLAQEKDRLEREGLAAEDVDYTLNPLRSFLLEMKAEIDSYERLLTHVEKRRAFEVSSLRQVGCRLIEGRIARGLTQRDLAARLEVHETQVSRDENNDYRGVTLERAARVLDKLGFQIEGRLWPVEALAEAERAATAFATVVTSWWFRDRNESESPAVWTEMVHPLSAAMATAYAAFQPPLSRLESGFSFAGQAWTNMEGDSCPAPSSREPLQRPGRAYGDTADNMQLSA